MARIVKHRKKKRFKTEKFVSLCLCLFFISGLLYLGSCLFLRAYNNNLSTRIQAIQAEISSLSTQNSAMEIENATLASSERVDEITEDSGMSVNQDSIVAIPSSSGD